MKPQTFERRIENEITIYYRRKYSYNRDERVMYKKI